MIWFYCRRRRENRRWDVLQVGGSDLLQFSHAPWPDPPTVHPTIYPGVSAPSPSGRFMEQHLLVGSKGTAWQEAWFKAGPREWNAFYLSYGDQYLPGQGRGQSLDGITLQQDDTFPPSDLVFEWCNFHHGWIRKKSEEELTKAKPSVTVIGDEVRLALHKACFVGARAYFSFKEKIGLGIVDWLSDLLTSRDGLVTYTAVSSITWVCDLAMTPESQDHSGRVYIPVAENHMFKTC